MKNVIKTLEIRIEKLNQEIKKLEDTVDEPEMLCDIEFAMNDLANFKLDIIEHQKAIEILNFYLTNKQ